MLHHFNADNEVEIIKVVKDNNLIEEEEVIEDIDNEESWFLYLNYLQDQFKESWLIYINE